MSDQYKPDYVPLIDQVPEATFGPSSGKAAGMSPVDQAAMHREVRERQDAARKKSQESLHDRLTNLEESLQQNRGEWPMQSTIHGVRVAGALGGSDTPVLQFLGQENGVPVFWWIPATRQTVQNP